MNNRNWKYTGVLTCQKLKSITCCSVNEYRLQSWIAQQEDIHRMVLFECDYRMSHWTRRCITQADCILIVALGEQEPMVGQVSSSFKNRCLNGELFLCIKDSEWSDMERNNKV